MTYSTRPTAGFRWRLIGPARRDTLPTVQDGVLNPRVLYVVRQVRSVTPETRLAEAMEILRMGPYSSLPVTGDDGALLGLLTEAGIVAALLNTTTQEERARLREAPARSLMSPVTRWLRPEMFASEASAALDEAQQDSLPVVDFRFGLMGMVGRSDLVQDLMRPFRPPMIGGMATPVGVYLTTGGAAGGVRMRWLVITGLAMCVIYLAAFLLTQPLNGVLSYLPLSVRGALDALMQTVVQTALLLGIVRLSPMSGYHAAEHQVVHAIERGEPLLVETVREMPRVHPRCGTNLVAGALIWWLLGTVLQVVMGSVGYLLAALVALAYWRSAGAWPQEYWTTRPATDAQLESGIAAARDLLTKYNREPHVPVRPLVRLWHMGFLQILSGFAMGCGLIGAIAYSVPALHTPLRQWLSTLW